MVETRVASWAVVFAIGLVVSFAQPLGIAASIAVPALVLRQKTRRQAFVAAILYYGAASWSIIPVASAFLGSEASVLSPVFMWVGAVLLLAAPWGLLWSPVRHQLCWRLPLALALPTVPPLGLIGWASPLTAAGPLVPGTGWAGLGAIVILATVSR